SERIPKPEVYEAARSRSAKWFALSSSMTDAATNRHPPISAPERPVGHRTSDVLPPHPAPSPPGGEVGLRGPSEVLSRTGSLPAAPLARSPETNPGPGDERLPKSCRP